MHMEYDGKHWKSIINGESKVDLELWVSYDMVHSRYIEAGIIAI